MFLAGLKETNHMESIFLGIDPGARAYHQARYEVFNEMAEFQTKIRAKMARVRAKEQR
jgi:hypothetical protein